MSAIRVEDFGGMIPSRADTLLPNSSAAYSQNAWLYHGDIQGFRQPTAIYTLLDSASKMFYRIPGPTTPVGGFTNSTWIEFADEYTNVIRAPMIQDTFKRYYFFSPSVVPEYNTLARVQASSTPYILGVPAPTSAPTVGITGADTSNSVTRAYVYTWVTAYGEEGPPSPPVLQTSSTVNTWTVNITAPDAGVTTGRNITNVNIYRTIADGSGSSTFFLLTTLAIATTSYVDSLLDTAISGNQQLPSTTWTPPPNLQGCVSLPNGVLAGWANEKEIWFCEPYRPHAWPVAYTLSVDYPIVGLAAMDTSLVVMTAGNPYIAMGTTPSTMTLSKIPLHEPCVSRHSIVATAEGTYYASANGLVLITPASANLITQPIFARHDWAQTRPDLFMGARYSTSYVAFVQYGVLVGGQVYDGVRPPDTPVYDALVPGDDIDGLHAQWIPLADQGDNGFLIDGSGAKVAHTRLKFSGIVTSVIQDEYTGEVLILSNGVVYQWDAAAQTLQLPYVWRTKRYEFPFPQQFIAAKVFFDVPSSVTIPVPNSGTRDTSQSQTFNPSTQYLLLRVYADGRLILVREIQSSGELIMFPDGSKAEFWQLQLEGQVAVKNIQAATSIKELQKT